MGVSLKAHQLGQGGRLASPLCVGTSGWGRLRDGETNADRDARTARLAVRVLATDPELNFLDASNIYGAGASEHAIGLVIERLGGIPSSRVVQTKLDRDVGSGDFSGDQMWRSLEQSLRRLHVERVQILFLHDPEHIGFDAAMASGGPVDALIGMKEQGLADSIGISGGPVPMLQQFVDTGAFDNVISHNRFTLIDRSAMHLYESAKSQGMGVVNAAPYGGGALSGRPGTASRYGYRPAPPAVQNSVAAMTAVCATAGVELSAAALQFSMRSPLVDSTIVGTSSVDRLDASVADARANIPDTLWAELDALAPARFGLDAPVPSHAYERSKE
jgi:D-threo-aldose 1-dehydrogenase